MQNPEQQLHPESKLSLGWILTELKNEAIIDRSQFDHLLFAAQRGGQVSEQHPFTIIAAQKWATATEPPMPIDMEYLCRWLAIRTGLPYLRIDPLKIDVASITDTVSQAYASRFHFVPVEVTDKKLVVATAEPFLTRWLSDLSSVLRRQIERVIANPEDIIHFRSEFYHISQTISGAQVQRRGSTSPANNFEQLVELGKGDEKDADDQHIVRVVDWLLQYAFEQRASDIHLEPRRETAYVRFRIDGILHQVNEMPPAVMSAVISRLKSIGRMNVVERRQPQDGRLKTKTPDGKEIELRLSTMPTTFGEKLVARIFDPEILIKDFSELGFSTKDLERWNRMVRSPYGMILVTGPTGSGKTTTLYSSLKHLADPTRNICTIEDPIEMVDPQFNQMHVQHNIGLDFASGVRTLLRQDPDIIMVGEIRDRETAETAIQAALTGHLVLSTLHTNDAPSAITRLLELGVPSYQINASLLGVVAQRLVRTLCTHCRQPGKLDQHHWKALTSPYQLDLPERIYQQNGCEECRMTGYHGRSGLYEILTVSDELRNRISRNESLIALRKQANKDGMRPLRLSGALKVKAGLTTPEEVFSVVPDTE